MQISFSVGASDIPRQPSYRVLVLGRFGFQPVPDLATLPVERAGLAATLARSSPGVALDIDNVLTNGPEPWWLKLHFQNLADFTPEGLIRQIPELAWIDTLRQTVARVAAGRESSDRLLALLNGYAGIGGLGAALEICRRTVAVGAPVPKPPTAGQGPGRAEADDVARIFDLVDLPGATPQPSTARDAMAGAIATLAKGAGGRPQPTAGLEAAVAAITDLLSRQLQPLLRDPRFEALEQAWRGLCFLAQGIGADADIEIRIAATDPDSVAEDLQAILGQPEDRGGGAFDLILIDLPFTSGLNDIDRLAAIAAKAEEESTAVLLPVADAFLVTPGGKPLGRIHDPAALLDQPVYAKWNAVRSDHGFRWLGACFNDFVLRPPYAPDQRHSAGTSQHADPFEDSLWGHASWIVARRILDRQQRRGWPVPIIGSRDGQTGDLVLIAIAEGTAPAVLRPLRHILTIDQSQDLAAVGILALSCASNQDRAWIAATPSLLRVLPRADGGATAALRRDASLSVQLLRGRLIRCITAVLDRLAGPEGGIVASRLEAYLKALVSGTGPAARVEVRADPEHSGILAVLVEFGEEMGPGLRVELQLGAADAA